MRHERPVTFVCISDYMDGDAQYIDETRLVTSWTDLINRFESDEAEHVVSVWQWLPHEDVSDLLAKTLAERDENYRINDQHREYGTPGSVRRFCDLHGVDIADDPQEPDPFGDAADDYHDRYNEAMESAL